MKNIIRVILGTILFLSMLAAGCGKITTSATSITATQTISTTATNFNNVNSASVKAANGLILSLSLNAKTYQAGYTVHIVITEQNTLSKMNILDISDKWPISGLSVVNCGTESYPFGVAVFQGSYTTANLSPATPLELYDPNTVVIGCMPPVLNVTAYDFKSSSDIATLDGDAINGSATFEMSAEVIGGIDWVGSPPNAVQQYFEPGVYTVVGGDEWGNMIILHFTVTN